MTDLSSPQDPTQPLRRIVRPTPIARQRKMTIGRIAANSQLMANSFGRSTSIRRSISSESSVRFPTWLLPALPARADDLDPYRDRDIIALRQSRMKNRVVRQVQPRGLPMASHAHGRSRSGVQTGPSSIARRLHPIRRQPNRNDAHIGPSTMPLVRVASQPQRPTARPPRTRSSATSAKNGNRTDRDGPRPRVVDSVKTGQFESHFSDSFSTQGASTQSSLSPQSRPKFESVMVARSLLARPQTSTADLPGVSTPDSSESSHRLTLPRASGRTSVDRSAIHRRTPSTRQPLVLPSSRIPLSMMYEAPSRLNLTSVAFPTSRVNTTQSRQTSSAPSSSTASVVARQTTRTSVQSVSPGSPTNRTVSTASNVGPSWTSFPTRESSTEQVSQRVISSDRAVTIPSATTPPSSQPLPKPQSSTLSSVSTSDTPISREKSAPATHRTAIDLTPPTSISIPIENDNVFRSANSATVRRRVGAVHIPRAAGWRQVMGLSQQSEQPTTPQTASHHQDSLFRRVAALANPTNAPLGSPGDIARRSPVSGSLISIASSMRSAVQTQRESSTPISSLSTDRAKISRKLSRDPASSARMQQSANAESASRSQQSATKISNAKTPRTQAERSEQITRQSTKTRNVARRLKKSSPSAQPKRSSASARSTILRSPLREQKPNASATSLVQKPSFVQLWSSVNQSVARQSSLTARRSLRLPQVRVHSLSSKPGAIVRQQFGLHDPSTETSFAQSSRSTVHHLRRQKSQRSNHALRSASHGDPSTARVMSVARATRSHMSSITPGASGGIQFAGSLAKAISLRQTHGDTARAITATNKSRQTDTAVRRSPASDSVARSVSPKSSRASSDWSGDSTSLTGAGSHVAQNFLDRLSRKTGEDFAPAITPDQGVSVSTSADSDVISRSVSRTPRAESTPRYTEPTIDQAVDSSMGDQRDGQPHWAVMRTPADNDDLSTSELISRNPSSADTSERASRAMGDTASVTNASIMRSVVANPAATRSEDLPDQSVRAKANQQRTASGPTSAQTTSSQTTSAQSSTLSSSTQSADISRSASTTGSHSRTTDTEANRSRQAIVERGGSIASRGVLHRAVSRSVPTQRLSSPLNDLPVSPNVTPGMRIPSEAMSALPVVPNVARTSSSPSSTSSSTSSPISGATTSSPGASISRSSSSNSSSISRSVSSPSTSNVRRDSHRSVSIRRQANGVQFGPSEDGTISADALVRMIESGQSIPNQVVHRQVSGTTSSGIMRRPSSSDQVSRSVGSTTIRRSSSTVEKAAPGPVAILSQVLAPSDDSDSGTSQITTSQLLDLMDWINRIVDDRLRQELERRGVAGGRW
ncbi:hypothetical protein GM51_1675 [freshwater metagenome]|uniref:Uncharacterized protein n=1 Tax=freshwater metagenome TaxID=449393 RepID=A0A094QDN8_9ZZZZ